MGQPTQITPCTARAGPESGPSGAREAGDRTGERWQPLSAATGLPVSLWADRQVGGLEAAGEGRRGSAALSLHFLSQASCSSRSRPLGFQAAAAVAAAAAGGSGSSFTPFLSSPLPHRPWRWWQRWGKADPSPSHKEEGSSGSRLAALSTLPSQARSARTSFSLANLVKQAGIYEWKGDQAQRGERCF